MTNFKQGDRVRLNWDKTAKGTVKAVSDTGHVWVHWDGDRQPYTTEAGKIDLIPVVPEAGEIWVSHPTGFDVRIFGVVPAGLYAYEPIVVYGYNHGSTAPCGPLTRNATVSTPLPFFTESFYKKR